jgi:hypothetical protein
MLTRSARISKHRTRADGVAEVVECLLTKCEALSTNPSTPLPPKGKQNTEQNRKLPNGPANPLYSPILYFSPHCYLAAASTIAWKLTFLRLSRNPYVAKFNRLLSHFDITTTLNVC